MTAGVVTCPEPLAAQAGAEILRLGGNALDAALATALAQGIADPMMSGIGGSFTLLYHDGKTGRNSYIAATGCAPRKATPDMWASLFESRSGTTWRLKDRRSVLGYQAQLVPGFLRGLECAYQNFASGRFSWADLFAPAIRLAEVGFDVPVWLWEKWRPGGLISQSQGTKDAMPFLSLNRAAAEIYAPKGRPILPGERLVQKDYANTLRRIAAEGADLFYTGEIARAIAEDFANNDGLLTYEDLRDFRAKLQPALAGSYRRYTVCGSQPPGLGLVIQQVLNVLELYDLRAMGHNTPRYLDLLSRVMQLAFADRLRYMADPDAYEVPVDRLISKDYARELRELIDRDEDTAAVQQARAAAENTTSNTVLDGEGNAVAMVHSINVGSGVVTPGLGFLHNSHMHMFNPLPGHRNSIAPGRIPISGSTATAFLLEGQPVLVLSSPGGARGATGCLQTACNVLEYGMGAQEAVTAGRLHCEDEPRLIRVDAGISSETRDGLATLGNRLEAGPGGRVSASYRDPQTGELSGGADPRGGSGIVVVD